MFTVTINGLLQVAMNLYLIMFLVFCVYIYLIYKQSTRPDIYKGSDRYISPKP